MSAGQLLDHVRAATDDEYAIEGELGRGGMAAVFLGRDILLGRHVAIKVMLPNLADVAGFQDRFVVEARTAAQLDHPGIVTVYAVKQRAGLTFIVMKYIEGRSLDRVLASQGALDSIVVATLGSHVAEALDFAHSRGVVHRDVKPANIIVDLHGRPIVTDFGIAKVTSAPSLTMAGAAIGTPGYMSPEQCRGLPVTATSDQYSLGVMLYELLTGHTPFSGTLFELLQAHANETPEPIRDVRPDVDPALEAIIMIMLAKSEAERFPSLRDVSRALAALVPRRSQATERQTIMAAVAPDLIETTIEVSAEEANTPTEATPPALPAAAVAGEAVVTEPAVSGGQPPRRSRAKQTAAVVVALGVLATVAYAIASRASATRTPPPQAPPPQAAAVEPIAQPKPADSLAAATPETTLKSRADTATPSKRETAAPVQASAPSSKPVAPKSGTRRDSQTVARPDSIAARCAALNLKFSLGEETTKADTTFLRRECAGKPRP